MILQINDFLLGIIVGLDLAALCWVAFLHFALQNRKGRKRQ